MHKAEFFIAFQLHFSSLKINDFYLAISIHIGISNDFSRLQKCLNSGCTSSVLPSLFGKFDLILCHVFRKTQGLISLQSPASPSLESYRALEAWLRGRRRGGEEKSQERPILIGFFFLALKKFR